MKRTAAFAMAEGLQYKLFSPDQLASLDEMVEIDLTQTVSSWSPAALTSLTDVEILITGWGAPKIDASVLASIPKLSAVLHTAGTVKSTVTPDVFHRGVTVTSCASANAIPVAEFTIAEILLAGKRTLTIESAYRSRRAGINLLQEFPQIGNFGSTVGIVSASTIGTKVIELLRPFDVEVLVYDPYVSQQRIADLGAQSVELDELLAVSDVVSLHAPVTPETICLIDTPRIALMKDGATLINTARPQIIDNAALRTELATGRIAAVLDVTEPEPLKPEDPLWSMPNVRLTPHLAGSQGNELHRMGASTVQELQRLVAGKIPRYGITATMLATMA